MDIEGKKKRQESFWTACPYCDYMYEYVGLYEDCCLRCQNQNCKRAFHGVSIPQPSAAMLVRGKDQHYFFSPWTMHMGLRPNPSTKEDDHQATTHVHNGVMEISSDDDADASFSTVEEEKGKKNKNEEKDIIDGVVSSNIEEEINNGIRRRSNVKCVARNTKKVTGRGKETRRLLGGQPSGATGSSTSTSINIGSGSHEDGSSSSEDLEFSFLKGMIFM